MSLPSDVIDGLNAWKDRRPVPRQRTRPKKESWVDKALRVLADRRRLEAQRYQDNQMNTEAKYIVNRDSPAAVETQDWSKMQVVSIYADPFTLIGRYHEYPVYFDGEYWKS